MQRSSSSSTASRATAPGAGGRAVGRVDGRVAGPTSGTAAGWVQFAWFVIVAGAWTTLVFALRVDPDYTAGELLDHLMAWRETGVLYPALGAEPPWRVLNYPPLVMAFANALTGFGVTALAAGRLVNDAGFVALVAGVSWWARMRGARGAALVGTVGLLGASFPVLYGAGQFHLELWAAAGTVWGYALLERDARWTPALAGLALALACFAKQSAGLPAVLALVWAWRERRAAAGAATLVFAATGAIGAATITLVWGAEPWRQMVTYTVGTYSLANLGFQLLSHALPWVVLIALAAATAWRAPARWRDPAAWYLVAGLAWALASAREGSGYPYFIDLQLATAVLVGPIIFGAGGAGGTDSPTRRGRLWRALWLVQIVVADVGAAIGLGAKFARAVRTERELPTLCAQFSGPVGGAPGTAFPALAEEAGVVRACRRAPVLQPFIMTSLASRGLWDASAFEQALRRGEYGPALLPFDPRTPGRAARDGRWTAEALEAFRSARTFDRVGSSRWMVRW